MFSQDENPVSDASNTRRILTPIFNPSLETDGRDALEFGGKKRKRDGSTMEDLLRDSFVVKVGNTTLLLDMPN
jgi:DNA replication regulator SLD3